MEKAYEVKGMTCVICKANVEKCLNQLEGVNSAIVSLMDNEVLLDYQENVISIEKIAQELHKVGYELVISSNKKVDKNFIRLVVSIYLMVHLMIISMTSMNHPEKTGIIQLLFSLCIILLNFHYYKSGFSSLFRRKPNMDTLVSISSFVSFLYSICSLLLFKGHLYFETSAMVLVIVSLGKYIEEKNKKKTTKFIRGLSTLIPMQANLYIDNSIIVTAIEEIKKGDLLLVKPGESIPQDGVVIEGSTSVDESMITGESLPSIKNMDDVVIGGTINIDGQIIIKVTKNSAQTTLSKIVSLTKQATLKKIPIERFVDKIASYFVVAVLSISFLTFIIWIITSKNLELSLNFALSVLVISCPCALGLATPSAIAVACNTSSKNGVLIKNPEILEIVGKCKNIIFDKTGTLTENKLEILKVQEYSSELEEVIASLEKSSNHPIALAILEKYPNGSLSFDSLTQISGEGIVGTIGNDVYLAGNETLCLKHNISLSDYLDQTIESTYIGVVKNKELLGIVYLGSNISKETKEGIKNLQDRNIQLTIATGDNQKSALKIGSELNISDVVYDMKPIDKEELVKKKKETGITAMVGDGINDAIALSLSDIAITLESGTDIANATGDVSLLNNQIKDISFLIDLGKKTMKIIKENLLWALGYNAIFIPLAAGCFYPKYGIELNPMIGSLTMSVSSIVVISNALRISRMKKENK